MGRARRHAARAGASGICSAFISACCSATGLEGRTVNAIDETTVQISDAAGQVASVEFDPQTGLPHRVSYDTPQAAGPPIYSEDVYDDFRDIGGVKIPFKITINQGGRKFADVAVKEYRINTGIQAARSCQETAMKLTASLFVSMFSLPICAARGRNRASSAANAWWRRR